MKRMIFALTVCVATLPFIGQSFAYEKAKAPEGDTLPLWELGVTGVGLVSPDYPGADEYQYLAIPLPNFIYRGEFLRADREGVRGTFVNTDSLEINVSFGGNLPTDDDNEARSGMPDLDPLVEFGPSIEYTAVRTGDTAYGIRLPVRFAYSVFGDEDFIDYQGIVVNPEATFETTMSGWNRLIGIEASAGPLFGFDGINEYFYEVDQAFARAGRPAYAAESGYMGFETKGRIAFSVTDHLRYFASSKFSYLGGATNSDSPLLRDDINISFVTGLTWSMYQSETRVQTR